MERYSTRTIDDLGRVVLHSSIRDEFGIKAGDSISLLLVDTIVILRKLAGEPEPGCSVSQVSELGVIEIPGEIRQKLNWSTGSKVAVYRTDDLLIIKFA